jgi:CBS domain containing-hemolysin-like protein
MDATTWLAIALLALATFLSTLYLALLGVSHSALQRRLDDRDQGTRARRLLERRHAAILTVTLLRAVTRVSFFAAVFVWVIGFGEVTVTWPTLLTATATAALLLWLLTSVFASAVARHAGTGVLVRSLIVLEIAALAGYPLAKMLAFVDEAVRRLSGANIQNGDDPVEAELLQKVEDAQLSGGLDPDAAELLENVVEFRSTDVGEVMTPRTDIDGIELTDDLTAIREIIGELGHSRIPVYEENLDHIVGILYVKDLVPLLGEDASGFQLRPLLRQPIMVPPTKPVRELLSHFQNSEVHMAIVIDEYGGTAGLATIEDVLEELVGEIHDEHDQENGEEPALTRIEEFKAQVDGRFHIDDLNEELGLELPEDEEFDTVAGFMLARLGRVPDVGEVVEFENARLTAIDTTPTHVRRIEVELLASSSSAP